MLDGSDVALKGGCAADVWDRTDAIVMFFSAYFSSNHIPPPELRPRRLQTGLSIRGFFLPTMPPGTPARGAWQTRDGGSTSAQDQPLIRRRRRHDDTRIRLPPLACRGAVGVWGGGPICIHHALRGGPSGWLSYEIWSLDWEGYLTLFPDLDMACPRRASKGCRARSRLAV